ncbi:hypothetical protein KJ762_08500 [bacterium]|nr:hypothetical protein [bacterium]
MNNDSSKFIENIHIAGKAYLRFLANTKHNFVKSLKRRFALICGGCAQAFAVLRIKSDGINVFGMSKSYKIKPVLKRLLVLISHRILYVIIT